MSAMVGSGPLATRSAGGRSWCSVDALRSMALSLQEMVHLSSLRPGLAGDRSHRRLFCPVVAPPGTLVAVVEQVSHIALVEWSGQFLGEVGTDIGEIERDAVV